MPIGGLSDQISDAASDLGAVAREQGKLGLKHAGANMQSIANDASERLGVVADRAQSQAASLGDTLEDAIQERPLSTLALALGLGFLVGVIWRRVERTPSTCKLEPRRSRGGVCSLVDGNVFVLRLR